MLPPGAVAPQPEGRWHYRRSLASRVLLLTTIAVGLSVARRFVRKEAPMVSLATAHPAKFPDAVEKATGKRPALPGSLAGVARDVERAHQDPHRRSHGGGRRNGLQPIEEPQPAHASNTTLVEPSTR